MKRCTSIPKRHFTYFLKSRRIANSLDQGTFMLEVNQINHMLTDLQQRVDGLRGYL